MAFGWPDAEPKARATADLARKRIAEAGLGLTGWHVELFGVNALHGPAVSAPPDGQPAEVVARLAWSCAEKVGLMLAGLEVPHVHVHLVPITGLSDLDFANADTDPDPAALDQAAETVRGALRDAGHAEVPTG